MSGDIGRGSRRLALFLAVALSLIGGGQAAAQPPVWIVRDKDSELVLFGSVHVLPRDLDWRPPALIAAMGQADDIWFELPMDPAAQNEVSRIAAQRSMMAPGQSLFDLLGPADTARILQIARAYQVDPAMLSRLQPWMADVALAAGAYRHFGAAADTGAERALYAEIPPGAALHAFETPAEQISLFADTPLPEQMAALRQTLNEMENGADEYGALLRAWMDGDLHALEHDVVEPLRAASPELFRRLVTERNARWVQVLNRRLKGAGRTVVVVGMGHLVGKEGLPEQLRALGYSVRRQ